MGKVNIRKATQQYEQWLRLFTPLVEKDLDAKHTLMAQDPFSFLRGAFYRWTQAWPTVCKTLAQSPRVLAVGDLHVENFGTWRDRDARLIWGVNDFDEAAYLPYTSDLTRLAASAHLAIAADHLRLTGEEAGDAILKGYQDGLKAGGEPFVLAERHDWLRDVAAGTLRDPVGFWQKLDSEPNVKEPPPESALVALEHMLPTPAMKYTLKRRTVGVGSLGHPRYTAVGEWQGGRMAREVKALVPSACAWAQEKNAGVEILYQAIVERAVRCIDPYVQLQGHWIARRLAPDCTRVELSALPKERDEARLLHAMGWETANIHLGTKGAAKEIQSDLKKRKPGWLQAAADAMTQSTITDWNDWKRGKDEAAK